MKFMIYVLIIRQYHDKYSKPLHIKTKVASNIWQP